MWWASDGALPRGVQDWMSDETPGKGENPEKTSQLQHFVLRRFTNKYLVYRNLEKSVHAHTVATRLSFPLPSHEATHTH